MSGLETAFLSAGYFAEEGNEFEPVAKSVCSRLDARGMKVTGEEVRRAVRELGVETRKVDGRLMAAADDVDSLVSFFMAKRRERSERSAAALSGGDVL